MDQDAKGNNNGSSWIDAYTELQDALTEAQDGYDSTTINNDDISEIWVANGVYKPHETDVNATLEWSALWVCTVASDRQRNQKKPARRNDPRTNGTILSGDLGVIGDFSDNSLTVVRIAGRTEEVNYGIPDYTGKMEL